MKNLMATLSFLPALALAQPSIDEKIVATFSDYNQFDSMVTCSPGYRGNYPTSDTITIKSHAIDLGLGISKDFQAETDTGRTTETGVPGRRPYEDGCKPAMEKLKAAIAKEVVEVIVHRTLTVWPKTSGRVYRKVTGEVLRVEHITTQESFERFAFELGGLKFSSGQTLNGRSSLR